MDKEVLAGQLQTLEKFYLENWTSNRSVLMEFLSDNKKSIKKMHNEYEMHKTLLKDLM